MPIVDLVVLFILGLHPDWRPTYCDDINMNKEICRAKQEEGYATAQLLAGIFVQESERAGLGEEGAFWMASIAMKENSLMLGDECIRTVNQERITVEELDPSPAGDRRARICVEFDGGRISCRNALVLEEDSEHIKVNYCMAGEIGTMQLTRFEASAGTVVPATGVELPRSYTARREILLDPLSNISLAAAALARLQDHCCGDDQECHDDWTHWVGVYNTGHCTGITSGDYGRRIQSYFDAGIEYMCSQAPDAEYCPEPAVEPTAEDPAQ